jgi:hypothetical protein
MVEAARQAGCRAEYMPLAFDTRARVCGMGVERDIPLLFCGTRGGNHQKREAWLRELGDLVTIAPPTFGRDYFRLLARAKAVLHVGAEWSRGIRNGMRVFEASGMGAAVLAGGLSPGTDVLPGVFCRDPSEVRRMLSLTGDGQVFQGDAMESQGWTLLYHTYESRIPRLLELARSL